MERANRKICDNVLLYKMKKPESSYIQVRISATQKEKFKKTVYVNYKLENFVYLLDVVISVNHKVLIKHNICNVP